MKFTFNQFQETYPDDDACLQKLFDMRFGQVEYCPGCAAQTTFHRVKKRKCYECKHCGHQLYPCAGTPFEKTRTSLKTWFHAMYMMTATRNGVSALEIQRTFGMTYKCAWRLAHQLRKLMGGRETLKLHGKVQIDEAYLGGRKPGKQGVKKNKAVVLGMVENKGNIVAKVIPSLNSDAVFSAIQDNVQPGTHVTTDELNIYRNLSALGVTHDTVQHRLKEFVNSSGNHTNQIEGFWSLLKRSISGTHVWVSHKHLPKYISEFEFRYNNRHNIKPMFEVAFEALLPSSEVSQNPQGD
jgi:transposase